MYKGTTPTFIFTLPDTVDLSLASNVYVTFLKSNGGAIEKSGSDVIIDHNTASVFLTQKESLSLTSKVKIQINWTYSEGDKTKRACSVVKTIDVSDNLISRVIS